jgi:hypothetical protein
VAIRGTDSYAVVVKAIDDEEPEVRYFAVVAVGRSAVTATTAHDALVRRFDDERRIRIAAAHAVARGVLRDTRVRTAAPAALRAMVHADDETVDAMLRVLRRAEPELAEVLHLKWVTQGDKPPALRLGLARDGVHVATLNRLADTRASNDLGPPLIAALRSAVADTNPPGNPVLDDALNAWCRKGSAADRTAATVLLSLLCTDGARARATLNAVAGSDDPLLAKAARDALERLGR